MNKTIQLNPDEKKYTRATYEVQLLNAPTYIIHADSTQDAVDALIDAWEKTESENPGYFLSAEDQEDEYLEEYIRGGNHGRYTSFRWHEIRVTALERRGR